MRIKRGDLYWVNLDPAKGAEQAGRRPVLVIQNNVGNEFAPTVIVAPLTTRFFTKSYPVNVHLARGITGLKGDSTVLLSQIRTIDKARLERKISHVSSEYLRQVDRAIAISLGLTLWPWTSVS